MQFLVIKEVLVAVSRRETNIRETANYLTFCFLEMANSTQARLGYFGLQGGERRLLSKQQLYNPGVERREGGTPGQGGELRLSSTHIDSPPVPGGSLNWPLLSLVQKFSSPDFLSPRLVPLN